jgi:hypothetical protein
MAQARFDQGVASADLPQRRMLMLLSRSSRQQAALEQLVVAQQAKGSALYHQWLTPGEFGNRFGVDDADLALVEGWLASQGFTGIKPNHARSMIEFSGTAGEVQTAFHTAIHKYLVNGELHWANASDPEIPTALAPVVTGLLSLHNFPRKPQVRAVGTFRRNLTGAGYRMVRAANPEFTGFDPDSNQDYYALGPADFAGIYNLTPLAKQSINGAGQTIAIAGQTDINVADTENFRSMFGLPANDPQIILDGIDPGVNGDEIEADLDTQWSGAVAPAATIDLVVSASTETTAGVDLSAEYIVDNNLAGILSDSYGDCELGLGTTGNQFYGQLWEQAAAQGITVLVASGDQGSAACDYDASEALHGLAVSGIASTPWNIAVGGTDFDQYSLWSKYWSTTNDPTTGASALGYIPEMTWNGSCTNTTVWSNFSWGAGETAEQICNEQDYLTVLGGSGGKSGCTSSDGQNVSSCSGGWPKPAWQSGVGVPADGVRDIPDVSLFASNGVTDSFYIICQQDHDAEGLPCGLTGLEYDFQGVGGTSASAPAFAGIMALVDEEYGRQGNANYALYALASAANASSIFHDVSVGTIAMPCFMDTPNCLITNSSDLYGVLSGYDAGTGYDLATGLGSVNIANLINDWNSTAPAASATSLELDGGQNEVTAVHGSAITADVTVTSNGGTPAGDIALNGATTDGSILLGTLENGTADGTVRALPGGSYDVVAHYAGNGQFSASDSAPVAVTITPEKSATDIETKSLDPWTGAVASITTATYGTLFIVRSNVRGASGYGSPTGSVALEDNGQQLDHPSYVLNSQGNAEDLTLSLQGGKHTLTAGYSGDASFNPSNGSAPFTVTPATMYCNLMSNTLILRPGWSLNLTNTAGITPPTGPVPPNGTTVAPTGTISFYSGNTLLAGPLTVSGGGSGIISVVGGITTFQSAAAWASTSVLASNLPNYTNPLTASYSGDNNYTACTSKSLSITYTNAPLATSFQGVISAESVNRGDPLSLNLTVSAEMNLPVGEPLYPVPTGIVQLVIDGANFGTPTALNSSGKASVPINTSLLAGGGHSMTASYSGDANYQPATDGGWTFQVNVPAIALQLSPRQVTVTNGATSSPVTVTASGLYGFQGEVLFSCSGLPQAATCNFSPDSVTTSGTTSVTIATTQASVVRANARLRSTSGWWTNVGTAAFSACFVVVLIPVKRRRRQFLGALCVSSILIAGIASCGGGGSSSGTPQSYSTTTSLTATTNKPAEGQQVTFTATVLTSGEGTMPTGFVTFYVDQSTSGTMIDLKSGSAQWTTSFSTEGTHNVTAKYSGGGGYLGSASPPYALNVPYGSGTLPGKYNVTVTGTSGALSASKTLTLTVH